MATGPTPSTPPTLPPITILIEWENAIDVEDKWTHRAMQALETELAASRDLMPVPPRVMYLYDRGRVAEELIRRTIATVAPRIPELCKLEMVPTPGLTYYKLKNYGVARTETEFVVMLDSDAAPQPGWLPGLLAPFADPAVMAVGGFTVLAYDDLLSKVLALIWIFHLRGDRQVTLKRKKINANNCAFRTAFFKANPWPDLPAFKKQCGFWLRDIEKRGIKWVRTVDAMTVHAPHPGYAFFLWRAWTAGTDRDVQTFHAGYTTRLGRLGYAVFFWIKRSARSTLRILTRGHEVELRWWQMPAALLVGNLYFAVLFVGQVWAALTRSYVPLAAGRPTAADVHPSEWRTTSR
jgi:hypothetical protein